MASASASMPPPPVDADARAGKRVHLVMTDMAGPVAYSNFAAARAKIDAWAAAALMDLRMSPYGGRKDTIAKLVKTHADLKEGRELNLFGDNDNLWYYFLEMEDAFDGDA